MKPKMKKVESKKYDKLDIIFGTNGPHVSELTPEDWFKIIDHAIRISERVLKSGPKFKEILEADKEKEDLLKIEDMLKVIEKDPYVGLRMLENLRILLVDEVNCKFSELRDILAVESEIIGIDGAIRRDIKIIRK